MDEVLGRQVALKLLHPNLAHDRTFVERLQREAVAVARINHPGIVAVFDTVNDAGYEAVVMEYVPGRTCASCSTAGAGWRSTRRSCSARAWPTP